MINVLITGANSYIGESVRDYLLKEPEKYSVAIKDTIGWNPAADDFLGFDVVFNVAGIVHIKETKENRHLYYDINRDLVVKIAKAAKEGGVRQFILLSTMSVYGLTKGHITKNTRTNPVNAYGKSKAEADEMIKKLADDHFVFTCLRPPMVYGKNCKGNYQLLRKFALKSPVFPSYRNKRSMIFIGNLCAFVKNQIDQPKTGVFFPQNENYVNTAEMVELIAKENSKRIKLIRIFNWLIAILPLNIIKKVFGDLTYEKTDTINTYDFAESIRLTEKG